MDESVLRDLVEMGKFLGSLDGIGIRDTPLRKPGLRAPTQTAVAPGRPAPPVESPVAPRPSLAKTLPPLPSAGPLTVPGEAGRAGRDNGAIELTLAAIRDDLGECRRCRLCEGRKNIVFGQGNPGAALMFVGEAPGADEDVQGLAFVGRAGQLLTDMVEKGMKLKRSDVFIANVIKCRPPGNRPPEADEIATCQPFLEAQIKAIQPRVIVALGATAAKFMARTAEPISRIRGRFASWDGIPVMPTYHPAYLLRNPAAKKTVWEDLKLVMDLLGLGPAA